MNPQARAAAIDRYNQAVAFIQKGKDVVGHDPATAYRLFSSSVEIDPSFKEGWYAVGNANTDLQKRAAAVAAYRRTLEVTPDDAGALSNMGWQLHLLGRHAEAMAATLQALKVNPDLAAAWTNLSLIQSVGGQLDAAVRSAEKGVALDTEHRPEIAMALAFALLHRRELARGFQHFEARFKYRLPQYESLPYPIWAGEALTAKTLLVIAEQGMGDALSFLRFVPLAAARGGLVMVMVHTELVRFAQQILGGFTNVLVGPQQQQLPAADFWVSIGSLPLALGLNDGQILAAELPPAPYHAIGSNFPWKIAGRSLHVGICWGGDPRNDIDVWRSVALDQMLDLYRAPGIQLYSLQVGERAQDIVNSGAGALVKDLAPFIRDVADTAALIRELDLVITCESAVGHIAGAVDADTWVFYSHNGGDWRIGRDERGPLWYPRHRVFKQGPDAQWQPVFDRMVAALKQRVAR